tara:strand:+ start:317 stop:463 length:147 start_codon:yes stop_codon:yes gene_type:complete
MMPGELLTVQTQAMLGFQEVLQHLLLRLLYQAQNQQHPGDQRLLNKKN